MSKNVVYQKERASTPPRVASATRTAANACEAVHSPDWSSVRWFGRRYKFGGKIQRACIALLWSAWEKGYRDVLEKTVLIEADSNSAQLRDVFRRNKAWGTLIQRSSIHGGPVGGFRLVKPGEEQS